MSHVDALGNDATDRVMRMVKDSGLPLEFWEQFPEWHKRKFAVYFLGVYLRIKGWEDEDNK